MALHENPKHLPLHCKFPILDGIRIDNKDDPEQLH